MFVSLVRYGRIQTLAKASLHFASANKSQILVLDFNLKYESFPLLFQTPLCVTHEHL